MNSGPDALGRGAKAFRALHALIAFVQLAALGQIWKAAITRRRGPLVVAAVGTLAAEGMALVVGRGDCPLGPLQAKLGDPVPLFELVLPPRAARAAVPVLTGIALAGMAVVAAQAAADRSRRHRSLRAKNDDASAHTITVQSAAHTR
jgi:hypothetical protein